MAWVELNSADYASYFANPLATYLGVEFNLLNESKVQEVRFLAYENDGFKLGIVVGERENSWMSPFSAPFGGFSFAKGITIAEIDEAMDCLVPYVREKCKELQIILPPVFYEQNFMTYVVSSLLRHGFKVLHADLNFAFDLKDAEPYEKRLWNMAKRNLKKAMQLNYDFREEQTAEGKAVSYSVIKRNREFRGYLLKMSLDALENTNSVVPIDFFTLYLDEMPVAAAVVYRVSRKIAQVIYWGDVPEACENRPMNVLAQKTFEHYRSLGFDYLDVGPSSEDGVPNVGLCAFKQSVGCFTDLKYAFVLGD